MKRLLTFLVLLLVVAALGAGAWWYLFGRGSGGGDIAALIPTGPIACPDDPNDLAGIEGWAPGAGKAEKIGQTNTSNFGGMGGGLAGGGGSAPTPAPTRSCTGLSSALSARFDTIAANMKLIPTDDFDPAVLGATFTTPDAAFAFVRDQMHTETYAGAMRGASGTLQSHGGSSADKALLLAALLGAEHITVRFAHNSLGDADAQAVLAAAALPMPAPSSRPLDDVFKQLGVDPGRARAAAADAAKRYSDRASAVIADAKAPSDDVLAGFAKGSVTLAPSASADTAAQMQNVRDHWWVQAQENGVWVDLDPTVAKATTGAHLGPAAADTPDSLSDPEFMTITLRLTSDRFAPGSAVPATQTILEKTVKLADTYGTPFTVAIGDRTVGADKIANSTSFAPTIAFGDDSSTGGNFDTTGLAVVRLQVETALGGTVHHVASRVVFDARNSAGNGIDTSWTPQKIAYALTTVYQGLALPGDLSPAFAGLREAAGLETVRAFMAYAAAGGNGKQMPPPGISQAYPLETLHYFEYDALVRRLLEDGSNGGVRFSFSRPQIAMERHGFDPSAASLAGIVSFDIADNGMRASGSDRAASARANVTRGYVDTETEQQLFAAPSDGGTIALFDAAKKNGTEIDVLHGDQYGGNALAPKTSIALNGKNRVGWWALDPADGNLVGRMGPDGAGQELAEYAIARANDWSTLYSMMQFYGDFFRCIAGAVEAPLSGISGAQGQKWFEQCAGAAICSYLEALGTGEAFSRWGSDEEALLYNILDLSIPGTKDSLPPTGGAICSGAFSSPLYPSSS